MKKLTKIQQEVIRDIQDILDASGINKSDASHVICQIYSSIYSKCYILGIDETDTHVNVTRFNTGLKTHDLLGVLESTKYDIIFGAKNNRKPVIVKRYVRE